MGVWDRDYSKTSYHERGGGIDWRSYLPPRGALALIALHVLGFFVVRVVQHDVGERAILPFMLRNDALHPAAILLHPLGNLSLFTLLFVVYAIWTLGGRVAARFGTGRLWLLYGLGTLIGGTVYFGFAQLAPELSRYPLVIPAGALAAWALGAWGNLSDEMVSVFGRLVTVAKATAIGAVIVAGLVFLVGREGATGWLIAAATGSLAWPMVSAFAGGVRVAVGPGPQRSPAPRRDRRGEAAQPAPDEHAIDDILAKISREGLDALTPDERERLEAARQARQRRPR